MAISIIRPSGLGDYVAWSAWAADGARAPGDVGIQDEAGTQTDAIVLPALAGLEMRFEADVRIEHPGMSPLTIDTGTTGLVISADAGHLLTLVQTGGGVVPALVYGAASGWSATRVRCEGASTAVQGPAVSSGAVRCSHVVAVATGTAWACARMEDTVFEDVVLRGDGVALRCNTWAGRFERVVLRGGYPWAPAALQCGWCGDAQMRSVDFRCTDTAGGIAALNVDLFTIPAGKTVEMSNVNITGTTATTLASDYGLYLDQTNPPVGTLVPRNVQVKGFRYPWRTLWSADGHDYCNVPGVPHNGVAPADDAYPNKAWVAGAHDISADPLFANEPAEDYRLGGGSPCLGAGFNTGVVADCNGVAYAVPMPIGAYAAADSTPPDVVGATSPGRWTAIVTFSEPVFGVDLEVASAWAITALDGGTAPSIVSVVANPAHTEVAITTGLLRSEGQYRATAPATIADLAGNLIGVRTGDFIAPRSFGIAAATVVGANLVRITFDHPFLPASVFDPAAWTIVAGVPVDPVAAIAGVSIESATEVALDVVPGVAPGTGYTISCPTAVGSSGEPCYPSSILVGVGAAIDDAPVLPPSESFVGVPILTDVATCKIYPMLQEGLRNIDQTQGAAFLERFLRGPDRIWSMIQQKIARLPYLSDPARCPAAALDLLRSHVAFGAGSGTPDRIARRLSTADLRRLIQVAVPYWRARGTRSALSDAIRVFASGIRPAIDDWFYLRWLVDDVLLGVEGGPGTDPWILYDPIGTVPAGMVDGAEFEVSVRVPDLGSLDRTLVADLCDLARIPSERIEIAFVDFLDTFLDGRVGLWLSTPGAGGPALWRSGSASTDPAILPGLVFPAGAAERVVAPMAGGWTDYVLSAICDWTAAHTTTIRFYWQDALNHYFADFASATGVVRIGKVVAGAVAILATGSADLSLPAARGVRIEALTGSGGNQIRVYVDDVLAAESVGDGAFVEGTVEFALEAGSDDGSLALCRTELFQVPLGVTVLGPR